MIFAPRGHLGLQLSHPHTAGGVALAPSPSRRPAAVPGLLLHSLSGVPFHVMYSFCEASRLGGKALFLSF